MENHNNTLSKYVSTKSLFAISLFLYFGFIIIPQWFRPFSTQFLLWAIAFPFVISTLLVKGVRGGIGLYREKVQPNPQHKFWAWLASLSIIWFLVSITLAKTTHFAYNHVKFDSAQWKNVRSQNGDLFNLSLRQRMLDDLTKNVLPQRTKSEVEKLLGAPDDVRVSEGTETFLYYIGAERGLGADSECLLIAFNDDGSLKEYNTLPICG